MNRMLWIGSLMGLMLLGTGCAAGRHGNCNSGTCGNGSCQSGNCHGGGGGLLGKLRRPAVGCQACGGGCRTGCQAGPLGWQQGGLDYSSHLQPGFLGHNTGAAIQGQPFQPGPPTAQTAYPYYTHRGPRDFLLDNPPSIGR